MRFKTTDSQFNLNCTSQSQIRHDIVCMHVKFELTVPHSQRYGTYTCIYYNKNNRRGHPCPMDTFSSDKSAVYFKAVYFTKSGTLYVHRICSFNMVVKIYHVIHVKNFYGQSSSFLLFWGSFYPNHFLVILKQ